MNAKERILACCKELHLTPSKVASELEMSSSSFSPSSMSSSLSADALIRFCELHPNVSAEWLIRCCGPMLIQSDTKHNMNISLPSVDSEVLELKNTIARQQREIDGLYERIDELKGASSIAKQSSVAVG